VNEDGFLRRHCKFGPRAAKCLAASIAEWGGLMEVFRHAIDATDRLGFDVLLQFLAGCEEALLLCQHIFNILTKPAYRWKKRCWHLPLP
jgi:hypothetical protein